MKIAFVYDRVNKIGGAERILTTLHEIWPKAPLFTSVYNSQTAPWARDFEVKTTFLQKIPFARTRHEYLALFTARAFAKLDLKGFDVVISITSAEAKAVNVASKSLHICYCLTPTRYLWSHRTLYESDGIKGKLLRLTSPLMRIKDFEASQKVDYFLAISKTVSKRINKYYRRDSKIIYPPVVWNNKKELKFDKTAVEIDKLKPYYLVVSRLVPYKRVDLAIKACNRIGKNLVIIGQGTELSKLQKIAGSKIFFTGQLTDKELSQYYMHCRGVLFLAEEDFGIVPVESQAYGKPVIAYSQGGTAETVIPGKTGVLFTKQDEISLEKAIKAFEECSFSSRECFQNAQKFCKSKFTADIKQFVEHVWQEKIKNSK